MAAEKRRIAIVGSGNWGTAVAKVIGENVLRQPDKFEQRVLMHMHAEKLEDGTDLQESFNVSHENAKYLPGVKVPDVIVASGNVVEVAESADVLVFVVPHQFVKATIKPIRGKVKQGALGITLCKGFISEDKGKVQLVSDVIKDALGIEMSTLMGANIAEEVANGNFSEATIGSSTSQAGKVLKEVFDSPYFRIRVVNDVKTVELCGALKNIVAVAAGLVDGLGSGNNTKAAVIRLGFKEMMQYAHTFHMDSNPQTDTFLESCGFGDLLTTCFGGRNRECAEIFAKDGARSFEQIEKENLNGQKLQGPLTAKEVYEFLLSKDKEADFPLFSMVHRICAGTMSAKEFVPNLKKMKTNK